MKPRAAGQLHWSHAEASRYGLTHASAYEVDEADKRSAKLDLPPRSWLVRRAAWWSPPVLREASNCLPAAEKTIFQEVRFAAVALGASHCRQGLDRQGHESGTSPGEHWSL